MPVLTNPRHELFAQHLASGKPAIEAYVLAGYKPNGGNASELNAKQSISNRVAAIQARNLSKQDETVQVSAARLAEQLAKAYEIAEQTKRPADMVAATIAQAKLSGQWVERSERTNVKADPREMTTEELVASILAKRKADAEKPN